MVAPRRTARNGCEYDGPLGMNLNAYAGVKSLVTSASEY